MTLRNETPSSSAPAADSPTIDYSDELTKVAEAVVRDAALLIARDPQGELARRRNASGQ